MSKQVTTEDFIKRARDVHGDKYDYSKTIYTTSYNKVDIICPIHGLFSQATGSHLCGRGCPSCAREACSATKPKDTEWFVQKAVSVHG